jgi:hypothetical protein
MRATVACGGGFAPSGPPPPGGYGPLDRGISIGGIGEGHGVPVASVPPSMPLPNSPDQVEGSKGLKPLAGGGPGEGSALPRATAAS